MSAPSSKKPEVDPEMMGLDSMTISFAKNSIPMVVRTDTLSTTASTVSATPSKTSTYQELTYANATPTHKRNPTEGFSAIGTKLDMSFKKAIEFLKEDGILDHDEVRSSARRVQSIVFLYGRGFMEDSHKNDRVNAIVDMVSDPEKRNRLQRIALVDPADRVCRHDSGFDALFNLRVSMEHVIEQNPDAVGPGFPREAFLKIQRRKNCYVVALCSWLTIQLQADMPELENVDQPIDTSFVVRRYAIDSDAALIERVVENKGGFAFKLAKTITGHADPKKWEKIDFDVQTALVLKGRELSVDIMLREEKRPGLVTGFKVSVQMRADACAVKSNGLGLGYYCYDGDNPECEGTWVAVGKDRKRFNEEQTAWKTATMTQRREANEVRKAQLKSLLDEDLISKECYENGCRALEQNGPQAVEKQASKTPTKKNAAAGADPTNEELANTTDGNSKPSSHAFVVLKGYYRDGKYRVLLLNSWQQMPLLEVSMSYLRACRAIIMFHPEKLQTSPHIESLRRDSKMVAEGCEGEMYDYDAEEECYINTFRFVEKECGDKTPSCA